MSDALPFTVDDDLIITGRSMTPSVDWPEDSTREFDPEEVHTFFEKAVEGYGAFEIGLHLGWTPAMIKRFQNVPEFTEMLGAIKEGKIDSWERALDREIQAGNSALIKYGLNTQARHRGYSDTRRVQVDAQVQQAVVVSVQQGLDEKTRALVADHGEAGIAALQEAYGEDDDITDAEIVE